MDIVYKPIDTGSSARRAGAVPSPSTADACSCTRPRGSSRLYTESRRRSAPWKRPCSSRSAVREAEGTASVSLRPAPWSAAKRGPRWMKATRRRDRGGHRDPHDGRDRADDRRDGADHRRDGRDRRHHPGAGHRRCWSAPRTCSPTCSVRSSTPTICPARRCSATRSRRISASRSSRPRSLRRASSGREKDPLRADRRRCGLAHPRRSRRGLIGTACKPRRAGCARQRSLYRSITPPPCSFAVAGAQERLRRWHNRCRSRPPGECMAPREHDRILSTASPWARASRPEHMAPASHDRRSRLRSLPCAPRGALDGHTWRRPRFTPRTCSCSSA